jgi:hypothetical protein
MISFSLGSKLETVFDNFLDLDFLLPLADLNDFFFVVELNVLDLGPLVFWLDLVFKLEARIAFSFISFGASL